jgi:hypothetical protein
MEAFEDKMLRGGLAALEEVGRFFMRTDPVHTALRKITKRLTDLGIPHAVLGGMALVAHGYDRTTVDVGILVTEEGLELARTKLSGLGYVPPFEGSRQLRDTETGVQIKFLVTGGFPGDGKPKPVAFPDPTNSSLEIGGIRYTTLPMLIELKLASGMTNPGRLKDLADVQELIRNLRLDESFADRLHPYVRARYDELRSAVKGDLS